MSQSTGVAADCHPGKVIAGMQWIPGGTFRMGADQSYPEEAPVHTVTVSGFWMDEHTVTNAEFAAFVAATGYKTVAERLLDPATYPGARPELLKPGSSGMVVSWPKRINDAGGMRNQFHHVIDIVPTVLDAIGIPQPTMVNGTAQRPYDGVSMVYTWDKANENAPSTRKTQYFEIICNRAIYHDGWMANTIPAVTRWEGVTGHPPVDVLNGFKWELFNLAEDPTQTNDLSAQEPERLRAMQELWMIEAVRNQVLPLNASQVAILTVERPGPAAGRTQFVLHRANDLERVRRRALDPQPLVSDHRRD